MAYSGGLDTSVITSWIKERYNCEIIAVTANVGQNDDFEKIKEKALGGKQNENDYYWLLGERPITTNVQFGLSADDEKCSVIV